MYPLSQEWRDLYQGTPFAPGRHAQPSAQPSAQPFAHHITEGSSTDFAI